MLTGPAARNAAVKMLSLLSRLQAMLADGLLKYGCGRFRCRAEVLTNGAAGADEASFRVQMSGRIVTGADDCETDVQVEISDITEGAAHAEPVLSADPAFQSGRGAVFAYTADNGRVPANNPVLTRWVTVVEVPCEVLRFACRGRRRLLFRVSVLSRASGRVLSSASAKCDFVSCRDGYREQQRRRIEVLQSTLAIAAAACSDQGQVPLRVRDVLRRWLVQATGVFPPAESLRPWLEDVLCSRPECDIERAADRLLAWGHPSDKQAAIELALQTSACLSFVSEDRVRQLKALAETFNIAGERFLEPAQRAFLTGGCQLENPSVLAGIDSSMGPAQIIKRLNDEYRKWNARVTHPSAEIRRLADSMLSLIADLRSELFRSSSCAN